MPIWRGMEVCQNRLVKFNKGLPTQLLARHAESVVMSATAQGQGNPGEELIKLDLQRAHQIDEQDADDALEGENGAAGKVASSLAMSGNEVHGSDEGVNFIDRTEILRGAVFLSFLHIDQMVVLEILP